MMAYVFLVTMFLVVIGVMIPVSIMAWCRAVDELRRIRREGSDSQ